MLGLASTVTLGALTSYFNKRALYSGFMNMMGRTVGILMIVFPFVYSAPILSYPVSGSLYIVIGDEFWFFRSNPASLILIFFVGAIASLSAESLSGRSLGIGYAVIGVLFCLWLPWTFSDSVSFFITLISAGVIFFEARLSIKQASEKESLEERCISVIRSMRKATLEDVMMELEISDYRADEILGDLFDREILERSEENKRMVYWIRRPNNV